MIPPFVDVICDCRALPGQAESDIREHVAAALGDGFAYELELLEPLAGGTESPDRHAALRPPAASTSPSASRVPRCCRCSAPGSPTPTGCAGRPGRSPMVSRRCSSATRSATWAPHTAADEAIEVADLVEMARFHLFALNELLAPGGESGCAN